MGISENGLLTSIKQKQKPDWHRVNTRQSETVVPVLGGWYRFLIIPVSCELVIVYLHLADANSDHQNIHLGGYDCLIGTFSTQSMRNPPSSTYGT